VREVADLARASGQSGFRVLFRSEEVGVVGPEAERRQLRAPARAPGGGGPPRPRSPRLRAPPAVFTSVSLFFTT
jgi:hypothetical protein